MSKSFHSETIHWIKKISELPLFLYFNIDSISIATKYYTIEVANVVKGIIICRFADQKTVYNILTMEIL